ncbi:hypothetical protein PACILC2_47210 [Paenibacillus cisolokensis]|uniref:RNA polymerase sigma factor n=1 Tax=Paenibacillus cisolokensis TaxID=1658519 RepID=A0ABQ4NDV1_9BACL|nr:RNA polymerase sigma factor [Paenibacillus cisolokensis]GIQ66153.1 hypothetical protein PACILC2_47210 [Paenibacillus cisolokensis]
MPSQRGRGGRDSGLEFEIAVIRDALVRYGLSLTGSPWDAEDLAQEACLKAMPVLQRRLQHDNPVAYALRIAKNVWIDQQRRNRLFRQLMENGLPGMKTAEKDAAEETEAVMNMLLSRLSPMQCVIFLLRETMGYTGPETANMLGCSEGAVKSALYRARRALERMRRAGVEALPERSGSVKRELAYAFAAAFRIGDAYALIRLVQDDGFDSTPTAFVTVSRPDGAPECRLDGGTARALMSA